MTSTQRIALLCASLLCTLPQGCAEGSYDVVVRFDPPTLAEDATRVEVALVPTCAGQALGAPPTAPVSAVDLVRMSEPATLAQTEPGSYGLYARALDDNCRVVAAGCESVDVKAGGSGTLIVVVQARNMSACATGESCIGGTCAPADGGSNADAGMATDGGTMSDGGAMYDSGAGSDGGQADAGVQCLCATCAECVGGACVPHHERCAATEYCDPSAGCLSGVACRAAPPECADDGNPCTLERCDVGRDPPLCVVDIAADTSPCTDDAGQQGECRAGVCCSGCWNGSTCLAGSAPSACGQGGTQCVSCDDGNPCTDDACTSGACTSDNDDTNSCPGGTCHGGSCCDGCWDGATCRPGTAASACGTGGRACASCSCPTPGCAAGACDVAHRPATVNAGLFSTGAVTTDGLLFTWGDNDFGQLGLGDMGTGSERLTPTRVGSWNDWQSVGFGRNHGCGIRAGGAMYCWGQNNMGQLGTGSTNDQNTPVPITGGRTWTEVYANDRRTCGRVSDGRMYCWGENNDGELGLGDFSSRSAPTLLPPPNGSTGWQHISLGHEHTCGIDSTGRLWCWGDNFDAQLGLGDMGSGTDRSSPTRVGTASDWIGIACGDTHSCGLRSDRSLWCWGANWDGQLAIGIPNDTIDYPTPQASANPASWDTLALGEDHGCSLTTDQQLWCWGENVYGQIGIGGGPSDIAIPQRVGSFADWEAFESGEDHSCAIRAQTLYCWGRNTGPEPPATSGGQLGQGDKTHRSIPTEVCFPL